MASKLTSRKFWIAAFAVIASVALGCLGALPWGTVATVLIWAMGAYIPAQALLEIVQAITKTPAAPPPAIPPVPTPPPVPIDAQGPSSGGMPG